MLSICYTCKNRSNLPSEHGDLPLLQRSIASVLGACINNNIEFEIIISDWKSTDTDYKWLPKQCNLVTVEQEEFSRGYGRNFSARHAKFDTLLFLDADILIGKPLVARCISVLTPPPYFRPVNKLIRSATYNDKTVYFPQCWCLTEEDRKMDETLLTSRLPAQNKLRFKEGKVIRSGWARQGFGICGISTKDFNDSGGWPEYYSWGKEDPHFYDYFVKNEYNIIREKSAGLVHMWHPPQRDV